ncbi:ABC transporter ATP-binding protein [Helicobacter sp. 16-1353]|uniref:ABC transporter ATP-binding protein n=1 Tax=Helicobacter sp. 16-1353 TaxID=2004996 RepID=UPI000DCE29FE|nr:ABC transporter ATP-binding protein [Helicobacter sp. 16-1353]RAX55234.1 ABC transporter ATP-binding protein [Helicobacter sp. 16-1353]
MNLVVAQNVSHSFDSLLYEDVNLSIESASSVAILGVSGSGKSTFINNLSTLLPPLSGKISLNGIDDIYSKNDAEILEIRRKEIGIIFQSHYLFRGFSALENLQVASILTNKKIDMDLLESFGIASVLKQQISSLSGGQQQRLSIARVLTKKPKIIFADEPTGNLDRKTSLKVMNVVFEYIKKYNASMIIATHDNEIANMCDRKFYLKDCKITQM